MNDLLEICERLVGDNDAEEFCRSLEEVFVDICADEIGATNPTSCGFEEQTGRRPLRAARD